MVFVQKQRCLGVLIVLIVTFLFMIQFYFIFGSLEVIRFELHQLKPQVADLQQKIQTLEGGSKNGTVIPAGTGNTELSKRLETFQIDHERFDSMLTSNVKAGRVC